MVQVASTVLFSLLRLSSGEVTVRVGAVWSTSSPFSFAIGTCDCRDQDCDHVYLCAPYLTDPALASQPDCRPNFDIMDHINRFALEVCMTGKDASTNWDAPPEARAVFVCSSVIQNTHGCTVKGQPVELGFMCDQRSVLTLGRDTYEDQSAISTYGLTQGGFRASEIGFADKRYWQGREMKSLADVGMASCDFLRYWCPVALESHVNSNTCERTCYCKNGQKFVVTDTDLGSSDCDVDGKIVDNCPFGGGGPSGGNPFLRHRDGRFRMTFSGSTSSDNNNSSSNTFEAALLTSIVGMVLIALSLVGLLAFYVRTRNRAVDPGPQWLA